MPRDPRHDILFEPVPVGPKTLKNRFYKTPHCSSFGSDRPGSEAMLRATAAEGGWAAASTQNCSIHPSSDDRPRHLGARLWDDNDVRNLALMCDKMHEYDSLAGVELWYGGYHSPNLESRMPALGVSSGPSDYATEAYCLEMDKRDIREVQRYYVDAAKRARSAGFDIVNVYGGHGHPITYQFFDPFYNRRTDEYGAQNLENRSRFWLETIEQVKDAVGDDVCVAVRMTMDSLRGDGSWTTEHTAGFMELANPYVDLWDMMVGGSFHDIRDMLTSRFGPENHQREWLEQVRSATRKPMVGVGRYTNPDTMAEMVRSGVLDVIGSARGSIADPFLPQKISDGRLDDIRECIGCNLCAARATQNAFIACTQNATAGEEYRRGWHPERFTKAANSEADVLVVGAGPAGMECAMVLGRRGMRRVHIVDAAGELGGIMRWIPSLPGLGEWARVTHHRQIQLDKLRNVEVILDTTLTADDVLEYGADIVVVATGAYWATDGLNWVTRLPIPGADASQAHVLTPEQIMLEGKRPPGARVVVYDTEGWFMGFGLAEKLALEGFDVAFATPWHTVSPYSELTEEGPWVVRRMLELGVDLLTGHEVSRVEREAVEMSNQHSLAGHFEHPADAIVLVTQRMPSVSLYRELADRSSEHEDAGIQQLHRIGDCVAPRVIAEAVFDGHRLGREIDSSDPAVPRPFIREMRLLGDVSEQEYAGRFFGV